jgi:hypothetical protein
MSEGGPLAVYQRRLAELARDIARLGRWDAALVWARVVTFVSAIVLTVLAVRRDVAASWPFGLIAVFAALVVVHGRVIARRDRRRAAARLCEDGVLRIGDQWAGKGDAGKHFQAAAEDHLYANDLDLYGEGGLYELLSMARTPIGQATLSAWLEAPATPDVVRGRQEAVAELAPALDLRHDLALGATELRDDVREEALMAWAARAPSGLAAGVTGPWPFAAAFVAGWTITFRLRAPTAEILAGVDRRADELAALARLMAHVEGRAFQSPSLRALVEALRSQGAPPSRRIARLRRLVDLAEGRRNQFAALMMGAVQATAQLALAIEAWRRDSGAAVQRWMAAVGELEALSSLATFHFEHPTFPFPTVTQTVVDPMGPPPIFDAEGLGHPLIASDRRVVNDLRVGGPLRLMLVSGSNMSGKSTLLRTLGINVALAQAGAPVRAQRLTLSPLAVGTSMRVHDSLQAGRSRFYAELTRLKKIMDRAGLAPPLLFLLDEILHGTNSHDRRIGAEGLIRGLVDRGAAGIVTTHDLALAEMTGAEALGARATNVHFEDHLEDGVMRFDFRMKPGVVRKSNAIALMRAVGLDV